MTTITNTDSGYQQSPEKMLSPIEIMTDHLNVCQNYITGFSKYFNDFMAPFQLAADYFSNAEQVRVQNAHPMDSFQSYMDLFTFNMDTCSRYFTGSIKAVSDYSNREMPKAVNAWVNTVLNLEGDRMEAYIARQSNMMDSVANVYPKAIRDVEPEFGFHFERGRDVKTAETGRFILYRIYPTDSSVKIREDAKPILILPPYVLGANILGFLPGDNRSYAHCYANMSIPTYIRILKDISTTPAVQVMKGEDDALDTKYFCEIIKAVHGKPVTLNGYCQGGYSAVCNILSGELDGLVDALITCVSPMDGTRSRSLSGFLENLPKSFNNLAYGTKTLPNGNRVADGKLMAWVYKLKSIENEGPVPAFIRDMVMLSTNNGDRVKISKTATAINYWLENDRTDLPLGITDMSFASYNIPVTKDGTLPVRLFDRTLNFRGIREKGIKWLICYGEKDDLVEPEVALAPLDYTDAEVAPFPKGHVAIATSWSDPGSAYALHTRFGENQQYRGPVRFQLDMDEELSKSQLLKVSFFEFAEAEKDEVNVLDSIFFEKIIPFEKIRPEIFSAPGAGLSAHAACLLQP